MIIDGVISGSGAVNQIGTGTTILAADNTYTGPTTIASGTLQVGNGGTTGTLGSGPLVNNGTLGLRPQRHADPRERDERDPADCSRRDRER